MTLRRQYSQAVEDMGSRPFGRVLRTIFSWYCVKDGHAEQGKDAGVALVELVVDTEAQYLEEASFFQVQHLLLALTPRVQRESTVPTMLLSHLTWSEQ